MSRRFEVYITPSHPKQFLKITKEEIIISSFWRVLRKKGDRLIIDVKTKTIYENQVYDHTANYWLVKDKNGH